MKQVKKCLSLLLALIIAVTATSVCFFAYADDGEQTDPVTLVEQSIDSWYSSHRSYMYSTKAADADKKEDARKAYEKVCADIDALSDSQVLSIDLAHYGYWLGVVSGDIARNNSTNPSKSPSTADKCKVFQNNIADIESLLGAFPKEYAQTLDAMKPYTVKVGTTYLGATTKINFKNNDAAIKLFDELISNIKGLTYEGLCFMDYLTPANTGGYYVSTSSIRASTFSAAGNLLKLLYVENQDLMTDKGADPKFDGKSYVSRTGSYSQGYTYAWKSGKNPQKYIDDFNSYFAAYQSDVVAISTKSYRDIYDIYAAFSQYQGLEDVDLAITDAASKIIEGQPITSAEVNAAIGKYNSLSETSKQLFDTLSSRSDSKLLPYVKNPYTVDTITPQLAYTKSSSVATYRLSDLKKKCEDFLNDLLLQEFNELVTEADVDEKAEEVVKSAKEKYSALPDDFKKKIPSEIAEKFIQLVKPEKDSSDLSSQINSFKKTEVVLPDNVRNEDIEYAVRYLYSLIADDLLPLLSSDIKLQNGLDNVLETKVYTNEMVSKIFSLYATLSHNESVVVESPKLTLGAVIGLLASPSSIANMLEEEKFSVAAAKIKPYNDFDETETMNKFDALAAEKFVNGDFGFRDGDREGFFDALLAVLRPITTLLAPGAKAAGLIAVNANMFDYVDDNGEYVQGVYSRLIPMLEQIGLTSLPTVEEYKKNYYDIVDKYSKTIAADSLLRPIIDSLLTDVLDMISPDPLNGIVKLLPRVAYIISTDMLNNDVKSALSQLGIVSGLASSINLTKESIDNKLTGSPIDLSSLAGTDCKIQLKAIDWEKLANCATVKSVPSASNSNAYFILRTGDAESCFTTVFYYVYSVIFSDTANYNSIKTLLQSVLGGTISGLVTGITDKFAGYEPILGYKKFLVIFNPNLVGESNFAPTPEVNPVVYKVDASKCDAKLSYKSCTYDGKAHKPAVSVRYGNKELKNGTDYNVLYLDDCTSTGRHAVLVGFTGDYEGTAYLYFDIKPKSTSIKSVKAGKKSFKVKWNKKSSQITGYEIEYSTSKSFKKSKKVTIESTSKTSKKISKLKAKKKYYVRVRTYKYLCGVKTCSKWSKAKTVKTR